MEKDFLKTKLQRDFSDCVNLDKTIVLGSMSKESGTLMLFDLLDHVKSDIATLDEEAYNILKKAEEQMRKKRDLEKYHLYKGRSLRDSAEKRDLQMMMLREDYKTCKELMYFIQNLCYTRKWFK